MLLMSGRIQISGKKHWIKDVFGNFCEKTKPKWPGWTYWKKATLYLTGWKWRRYSFIKFLPYCKCTESINSTNCNIKRKSTIRAQPLIRIKKIRTIGRKLYSSISFPRGKWIQNCMIQLWTVQVKNDFFHRKGNHICNLTALFYRVYTWIAKNTITCLSFHTSVNRS